jgi:hypothetical protein
MASGSGAKFCGTGLRYTSGIMIIMKRIVGLLLEVGDSRSRGALAGAAATGTVRSCRTADRQIDRQTSVRRPRSHPRT